MAFRESGKASKKDVQDLGQVMGGGVIVYNGAVTGFVGVQTFGFLLTLFRHSQNLDQAYSDILISSVLFWGLFLCVL